MKRVGFRVTHVYGLTEAFGPAVRAGRTVGGRCRGARAHKGAPGRALSRLEGLTVVDPETLEAVPGDGVTMGEVLFRGNAVMKGYLKNEAATAEAFAGGWFHTGDLGVRHPDGYIEIKDRSKDIIISGGENISSIEVENVLIGIGRDESRRWWQGRMRNGARRRCAFVTLAAGGDRDGGGDSSRFCRAGMAHFKIPRTVVFGPLPKTSTGKMQKYVLRDRARAL